MVLLGPQLAEAQQRGRALVYGDAACPDPVAVQAEVFRLTSPARRAQDLPGASVRVVDSGDNYSIEIQKKGERFVKAYSDPARECQKRVRFAAVYVVMTLMPPDFGDDDADSSGTPANAGDASRQGEGAASGQAASEQGATPGQVGTSEPAEASQQGAASEQAAAPKRGAVAKPTKETKLPPEQRALDSSERGPGDGAGEAAERSAFALELGLSGAQSLSNSEVPQITSFGGEVLAQVGRGFASSVTAISVEPLSPFTLGDLSAKLSSGSLKSGVRLSWEFGGLAFASDANLVLAWRRVTSDGVPGSEGADAWEWGALLNFALGYRWHERVTPFIALRGSYFPAPSELVALPRGTLGTLPKVWLGGLLGVRFSL